MSIQEAPDEVTPTDPAATATASVFSNGRSPPARSSSRPCWPAAATALLTGLAVTAADVWFVLKPEIAKAQSNQWIVIAGLVVLAAVVAPAAVSEAIGKVASAVVPWKGSGK